MSNHAKPAPQHPKSAEEILGTDTMGLLLLIADAIWPLMVGGLILFLMILKGWERAAIPVGIAVIVVQAWFTYG